MFDTLKQQFHKALLATTAVTAFAACGGGLQRYEPNDPSHTPMHDPVMRGSGEWVYDPGYQNEMRQIARSHELDLNAAERLAKSRFARCQAEFEAAVESNEGSEENSYVKEEETCLKMVESDFFDDRRSLEQRKEGAERYANERYRKVYAQQKKDAALEEETYQLRRERQIELLKATRDEIKEEKAEMQQARKDLIRELEIAIRAQEAAQKAGADADSRVLKAEQAADARVQAAEAKVKALEEAERRRQQEAAKAKPKAARTPAVPQSPKTAPQPQAAECLAAPQPCAVPSAPEFCYKAVPVPCPK